MEWIMGEEMEIGMVVVELEMGEEMVEEGGI